MHRIAIAVACAALLVTSCAPPAPAPPDGWTQAYITRDGNDTLTITDTSGNIRVEAPTSNAGGNSRTLLWRTDSPATSNHTACVTATHSGWPVQEGVALRIAPSPIGAGTRAITVQKNIWARGDRVYNVHLWDSSPGADDIVTHTLVSSIDMSAAVAGTTPTDGRRLCARITNRTLEYKVWPSRQPEPAWGDPTHSRTTTLPADWVYPGVTGVYIAHLEPGDWATLTNHTPTTTVPPTTTTTTTTEPTPEPTTTTTSPPADEPPNTEPEPA